MKALIRRTKKPETEKVIEQITYQTLTLDIIKKKVSIDNIVVILTKTEFEILLLLLQNTVRVFSSEDLLTKDRYNKLDTTHIGVFDDNRWSKKDKRYRPIFIRRATLLTKK